MAGLPNPSAVATIVLPGDEDPKAMLTSGKFEMSWGTQKTKKFREVTIPHDKQEGLSLPTLYLHFLDEVFRCKENEGLVNTLRAGNDMSEVILKLPSKYMERAFADGCGELSEPVTKVIEALKSLGEVFVSTISSRGAGAVNAECEPGTLFYSLKTARPKAGISLDKKAFGIPQEAEQYLFVNNHASVVHLNEDVKTAFNECIGGLPDSPFPDAQKFAVFLKVFYEGGFGYNKKIPMGSGYLPVNVGTAAMSVVPAFKDQIGIGTGFPYKLPPKFLQFTETVPISIEAISQMSERHGRYGLAFTRTVYVWEGDAYARDKTLDFCSILPHGGFFYLPAKYEDYQKLGGYVYAFGESTGESNELSAES